MKPNDVEQEVRLGIFWLVPAGGELVLLSHILPLERAEEYGDCLTCPLSHYDAWEATKRGKPMLLPLTAATKALIAASEYEDWPRGRVTYDRSAKSFIIYTDRQVFHHASRVRAHFSLPETTPLRTDPHYRHARRLSESQYVPDQGNKQ